MMKHGVHSRNQSKILKKYQRYSKFRKTTKPIPDGSPFRPGLALSFCEILNKLWYFLGFID